MNFFKSLFNNKPEDKPEPKAKNENLLALIRLWYLKPTDDSYKKVVFELMEGKAFLLLPSVNENHNNVGWQTTTDETELKLLSVFEMEGVKTLGAFTDSDALLSWSNKQMAYTEMRSDDVLLLCEKNGISRVVINSNSYNMFVLERSRASFKPQTIPQGTQFEIGLPDRPLSKAIINKLTHAFKNDNNIEAAYQYLKAISTELSFVLCTQLNNYDEQLKTKVLFAVQAAIRGEDLEFPLDVVFIDHPQWLQTIHNIPDGLFYSK